MPTILNKKYIYNNDMYESLESDYLTELANLLSLKLLNYKKNVKLVHHIL